MLVARYFALLLCSWFFIFSAAPIAISTSANCVFDRVTSITLLASGTSGGTLYRILTNPAFGVLVTVPGNLTIAIGSNFSSNVIGFFGSSVVGSTSFAWQADSSTATLTIQSYTPDRAVPLVILLNLPNSVPITLQGRFTSGAVVYNITTLPVGGLLFNTTIAGDIGSGAVQVGSIVTSVVYFAPNDVSGSSTFNYTVIDAFGSSIPAVVVILKRDVSPPLAIRVFSLPSPASYRLGSQVNITLEMDEPVVVIGSPTISLSMTRSVGVPASAAVAIYTGGNATANLTFTLSVVAGLSAKFLDYVVGAALSATPSDCVIDLAGNRAPSDALPTAGTPGSLSNTSSICIDSISPTVANVAFDTPSGQYGIGFQILIHITFTEIVYLPLGCSLRLQLASQALPTYAALASGNGTDTMRLLYVVKSGDATSALDVAGPTALATLGCSGLIDFAGNVANMTLPHGIASGGIALNSTVPFVTRVRTTSTNGTYYVGSRIILILDISWRVSVSLESALPVIHLNTGLIPGVATLDLSHGLGPTLSLTFAYTVTPGQRTSRLCHVGALDLLDGSSIQDAFGNQLNVSLPAPGSSTSLCGPFSLAVVSPPAVGFSTASLSPIATVGVIGTAVTVNLTFSDIVLVVGSPTLTVDLTSRVVGFTFRDGNMSDTLSFTSTVVYGDSIFCLDYQSPNALSSNGGRLQSLTGIDAYLVLPVPGETGSVSSAVAIVIDTLLRNVVVVPSTTHVGEATEVTIVFNTSISWDMAQRVNVVMPDGFSLANVTLKEGPPCAVTSSGNNITLTLIGSSRQPGQVSFTLDGAVNPLSLIPLDNGVVVLYKDDTPAQMAMVNLPSLTSGNLSEAFFTVLDRRVAARTTIVLGFRSHSEWSPNGWLQFSLPDGSFVQAMSVVSFHGADGGFTHYNDTTSFYILRDGTGTITSPTTFNVSVSCFSNPQSAITPMVITISLFDGPLLEQNTNVTGPQLTPLDPTSLQVRSDTPSAIATRPLSPSVRIAAVDGFGNVVRTATGMVSLMVETGPTNLSGTTSRFLVNGETTFDDIALETPYDGYVLVAVDTSGTFANCTLGPFNVSRGLRLDSYETVGYVLAGGQQVAVEVAVSNEATTLSTGNTTLFSFNLPPLLVTTHLTACLSGGNNLSCMISSAVASCSLGTLPPRRSFNLTISVGAPLNVSSYAWTMIATVDAGPLFPKVTKNISVDVVGILNISSDSVTELENNVYRMNGSVVNLAPNRTPNDTRVLVRTSVETCDVALDWEDNISQCVRDLLAVWSCNVTTGVPAGGCVRYSILIALCDTVEPGTVSVGTSIEATLFQSASTTQMLLAHGELSVRSIDFPGRVVAGSVVTLHVACQNLAHNDSNSVTVDFYLMARSWSSVEMFDGMATTTCTGYNSTEWECASGIILAGNATRMMKVSVVLRASADPGDDLITVMAVPREGAFRSGHTSLRWNVTSLMSANWISWQPVMLRSGDDHQINVLLNVTNFASRSSTPNITLSVEGPVLANVVARDACMSFGTAFRCTFEVVAPSSSVSLTVGLSAVPYSDPGTQNLLVVVNGGPEFAAVESNLTLTVVSTIVLNPGILTPMSIAAGNSMIYNFSVMNQALTTWVNTWNMTIQCTSVLFARDAVNVGAFVCTTILNDTWCTSTELLAPFVNETITVAASLLENLNPGIVNCDLQITSSIQFTSLKNRFAVAVLGLLSASVVASPAGAVAGANVTWTVMLTNHAISSVTIGAIFTVDRSQFSAPPSLLVNNRTVILCMDSTYTSACALPSLASGNTTIVISTRLVTSLSSGMRNVPFNISGDASFSSLSGVLPLSPSGLVTLTVVNASNTIIGGDTMDVTMVLFNYGAREATPANTTLTVDASLLCSTAPAIIRVDGSSGVACIPMGSVVVCAVGSVAPTSNVTLSLGLRTKATITPGVVNFSFNVNAGANFTGSSSTAINFVLLGRLTVLIDPTPAGAVAAGSRAVYRLSISNLALGNTSATSFTVACPFIAPTPIPFIVRDGVPLDCSRVNGGFSCAIGGVLGLSTVNVSLNVNVAPNADPGLLNLVVTTATTNGFANTSVTTSQALLGLLSVSTLMTKGVAGQTVALSGVLTNNASSTNAPSPTLMCLWPVELVSSPLPSVTLNGGPATGCSFLGLLICPLASLPAAAVTQIALSAMASISADPGTLLVACNVSSSGFASTSAFFSLAVLGQLSISTAGVAPSAIVAGDQLNITLIVNNAARSTAVDVNITLEGILGSSAVVRTLNGTKVCVREALVLFCPGGIIGASAATPFTLTIVTSASTNPPTLNPSVTVSGGALFQSVQTASGQMELAVQALLESRGVWVKPFVPIAGSSAAVVAIISNNASSVATPSTTSVSFSAANVAPSSTPTIARPGFTANQCTLSLDTWTCVIGSFSGVLTLTITFTLAASLDPGVYSKVFTLAPGSQFFIQPIIAEMHILGRISFTGVSISTNSPIGGDSIVVATTVTNLASTPALIWDAQMNISGVSVAAATITIGDLTTFCSTSLVTLCPMNLGMASPTSVSIVITLRNESAPGMVSAVMQPLFAGNFSADMFTIPLTMRGRVLVTFASSGGNVAAGNAGQAIVVLRNLSPAAATGAVLSVSAPLNSVMSVTFSSNSSNGACSSVLSATVATFACPVGSLLSQSGLTVIVAMTVSRSADPGQLTPRYSLDAGSAFGAIADLTPSPYRVQGLVDVVGLNGASENTVAGESVHLGWNISNLASSTSTPQSSGTRLAIVCPDIVAALIAIGDAPATGCVGNVNAILCTLGALEAGGVPLAITVTAVVSSTRDPGTLSAVASVMAGTSFVSTVGSADRSIVGRVGVAAVSVSATEVPSDSVVVYTLIAINYARAAATPAPLSTLEFSSSDVRSVSLAINGSFVTVCPSTGTNGDTITCPIGSLPPSSNTTLSVSLIAATINQGRWTLSKVFTLGAGPTFCTAATERGDLDIVVSQANSQDAIVADDSKSRTVALAISIPLMIFIIVLVVILVLLLLRSRRYKKAAEEKHRGVPLDSGGSSTTRFDNNSDVRPAINSTRPSATPSPAIVAESPPPAERLIRSPDQPVEQGDYQSWESDEDPVPGSDPIVGSKHPDSFHPYQDGLSPVHPTTPPPRSPARATQPIASPASPLASPTTSLPAMATPSRPLLRLVDMAEPSESPPSPRPAPVPPRADARPSRPVAISSNAPPFNFSE